GITTSIATSSVVPNDASAPASTPATSELAIQSPPTVTGPIRTLGLPTPPNSVYPARMAAFSTRPPIETLAMSRPSAVSVGPSTEIRTPEPGVPVRFPTIRTGPIRYWLMIPVTAGLVPMTDPRMNTGPILNAALTVPEWYVVPPRIDPPMETP